MDTPNRRTADEAIGYLDGRLDALNIKLTQHINDEGEVLTSIQESIANIERRHTFVKHMFMFGKAIGMTVLIIFSLKPDTLQTIAEVWGAFWKFKGL